jgi:hypothetical protein
MAYPHMPDPPETIRRLDNYGGGYCVGLYCRNCRHQRLVPGHFFIERFRRADLPLKQALRRCVCSVCRSRDFDALVHFVAGRREVDAAQAGYLAMWALQSAATCAGATPSSGPLFLMHGRNMQPH